MYAWAQLTESELRINWEPQSADLFTFCKQSAERAAIASPQQHVWCGFDLVYSFCYVFLTDTFLFCQFRNFFLFIVPPYHNFCILLAANIVNLCSIYKRGDIFIDKFKVKVMFLSLSEISGINFQSFPGVED
jgi:hypothetical protein